MRTDGFVIAAVLAVAAAWSGAAAEPELELRLETAGVALGDRIPVELVARGGGDGLWGDLSVQIPAGGEWAVVEGPEERPGSAPPAWTVTLVPLAVGDLDLPAMVVGVRDPAGAVRQVRAPDAVVTVGSVLAADDGLEPAALKPPVGVEGLPWEWLVPGLIVLLPMAAAAAWWRARSTRAAGAGGPGLPDPSDELIRALDELRGAVGRESTAAVCDRLAHCVRRYLERRTGDPALEMTSAELVALARRGDWPAEVQQWIRRITLLADEVRFARRAREDAALLEAADGARRMAAALDAHLMPPDAEEAA